MEKWVLPAVASAAALSIWKLVHIAWYNPYGSPLRHLQGPQGTSFILGNLVELSKDENFQLLEQWLEEYGGTMKFHDFLNKSHLLTTDTRAIGHILNHANDFQKKPDTRAALGRIFGEGLLVAEGAQHHQQRRVMNPAFGPAQIRALTETFFRVADRLRDIWSSEFLSNPAAAIAGKRIDIVPWMSKVSLDIIGITGFDYDFDALSLSGQSNELNDAFTTMFAANQRVTMLDILHRIIPFTRIIDSDETRKMKAAQRAMTRIGTELLANAKANVTGSENGTKGGGRDLLSLLVKANMAVDNPRSQMLSDKDVIAQVPTFFVAGHETTSTALTWALYALSQAPEIQTRLRDELLSVDTDTPSMDQLVSLPYLDMVVRETLRLYAPVPFTSRIAMKDDELPVEKPYKDRYGVLRKTITIIKGDPILIPIVSINRSKELWGPDAHEFKPDRWNGLPETTSQIPSVWGHMLTFISGPRACIGYRFSLVETKAILFSLLRAFEFELGVRASDVSSRAGIVRRPVLRGDSTYQPQLTILVKPFVPETKG